MVHFFFNLKKKKKKKLFLLYLLYIIDNGIKVKSEVNKGSSFSFVIDDKIVNDYDIWDDCDISHTSAV